MEFNEYARWHAESLEKNEKAQEACMKMFEQTGEWEWISAAADLRRRAEDDRKIAVLMTGWYLV